MLSPEMPHHNGVSSSVCCASHGSSAVHVVICVPTRTHDVKILDFYQPGDSEQRVSYHFYPTGWMLGLNHGEQKREPGNIGFGFSCGSLGCEQRWFVFPLPHTNVRTREPWRDRVQRGTWLSGPHLSLGAPWEGHREILLMKLGLRGLPYLIAVPTRLHFLLSTGIEKSDGSPMSTPCPEQDLVPAKD